MNTGAQAGAGLTEDVGEGLVTVEGLAEGLGVGTGGAGEGLGVGAGLAAGLGVVTEPWRKDGPGLFGRPRSKLRPPPGEKAKAKPADSPLMGDDGREVCEPSSLSEASSSPPSPEPKPPRKSGIRAPLVRVKKSSGKKLRAD